MWGVGRRSWSRPLLLAASSLSLLAPPAPAQVLPLAHDQGAVGLGLALRRLPVAGSVLYVTAHPDDENNGVLVKLSRGLGLRVGLLTLTRGEGGQNQIGPELFDAIGILRSEELAAVHRYDGAQQFFSRAKDFGFSFSVDETFQKWGRDEILADVVRVVRSFRPDVILTLPLEAPGGGQHHQAASRLAQEAFRVAADPSRFPEQVRDGLRAWQAVRIYQGGTGGGTQEKIEGTPVPVATNVYDPLLGMSWAEFGSLARASHRCQGTSQLKSTPGEGRGVYYLIDQELPAAKEAAYDSPAGSPGEVLSGVDLSLRGLARFAGGVDREGIANSLAALQTEAERAQQAFDARAPERAAAPLRKGLVAVRALEQKLATSGLSDAARYELGVRLSAKARDFERALTLALGLVLEASTDDGDVIPGQEFTTTTRVWNGGAEPLHLEALSLDVPAGWSARVVEGETRPLGPGETAVMKFTVKVPPDARLSQPYWRSRAKSDRYELALPEHRTLPWSPADVVAKVRVSSDGVPTGLEMPVYKRSEGRAGGEKQKIVNVVPALSLTLSPRTAVVPLSFAGRPREFRVTVGNNVKGPASARAVLEAPPGWRVDPAAAPVEFAYEGEQVSLRFSVTPPEKLAAGDVEIRAVVRLGEREYREGYQAITYDHIQERHLYRAAAAVVRALDVRVAPGATVGYVMGSGDEGPQAIEQLGIPVTLLTADDLAWGDLGRFRTIVTGIRAYETRPDLRAHNHRLLSYVERGGHLLVQYNRFEFNQLAPRPGGPAGGRPPEGPSPFAPHPAAVTADRATVEEAEVHFRLESPVLTVPNRLTAADFGGWVQERGLHFLAPKDPRYRDLLAVTDPWPKNPGEKTGLLVETTHGKGTWTYTGLSLFRQLPAGVPGAYRLLANLLSRPAPTRKGP